MNDLAALRDLHRQMGDILARIGVEDEADAFPISAIDTDLLLVLAPSRSRDDLAQWVEPLQKACRQFAINTVRRVAAFLTTIAHEGQFKVGVRENMNYSAKRLSEVWPGRFGKGAPNALALAIAGNPEAIANNVYANRMGNGPPESGDGWMLRGNGPMQLTGRDNHEAFAKSVGMTLEVALRYIATLEGGIMSAAWFWLENGVNELADTPGVEDETKRINGGLIGLHERRALFNTCVAELLRREPK